MSVKLLLIAEIEAANDAEAQERLDAFREDVMPAENYGISLWRANHNNAAGAIDAHGIPAEVTYRPITITFKREQRNG